MQRPDYICIDMDGVLVDLHTPMIELFGDDPSTYSEAQWADVGEWGIGIPEVAGKFEEGHFWDKIKAQGADWWAGLPKLPWADDLWHAALETGASVTVLSTPAYFSECAAGKWAWCLKNLAPKAGLSPKQAVGECDPLPNVLIGKPKYACAKAGSWLIDDRAMYSKRWEKEGGTIVSLKRPWNPEGLAPETIIQMLRSLKKEG